MTLRCDKRNFERERGTVKGKQPLSILDNPNLYTHTMSQLYVALVREKSIFKIKYAELSEPHHWKRVQMPQTQTKHMTSNDKTENTFSFIIIII
jgi:hypothetical protein